MTERSKQLREMSQNRWLEPEEALEALDGWDTAIRDLEKMSALYAQARATILTLQDRLNMASAERDAAIAEGDVQHERAESNWTALERIKGKWADTRAELAASQAEVARLREAGSSAALRAVAHRRALESERAERLEAREAALRKVLLKVRSGLIMYEGATAEAHLQVAVASRWIIDAALALSPSSESSRGQPPEERVWPTPVAPGSCPDCHGTGEILPSGPSDAPVEICERCSGDD